MPCQELKNLIVNNQRHRVHNSPTSIFIRFTAHSSGGQKKDSSDTVPSGMFGLKWALSRHAVQIFGNALLCTFPCAKRLSPAAIKKYEDKKSLQGQLLPFSQRFLCKNNKDFFFKWHFYCFESQKSSDSHHENTNLMILYHLYKIFFLFQSASAIICVNHFFCQINSLILNPLVLLEVAPYTIWPRKDSIIVSAPMTPLLWYRLWPPCYPKLLKSFTQNDINTSTLFYVRTNFSIISSQEAWLLLKGLPIFNWIISIIYIHNLQIYLKQPVSYCSIHMYRHTWGSNIHFLK